MRRADPIRWAARLALAAAFGAAGVGCAAEPGGQAAGQAAPPAAPVAVPLTMAGEEPAMLALVPVVIGGEGPFSFALDTGVARSAIARDVADRLGLPTTGETQPLAAVTGEVVSGTVAIEQWAIGDVAIGAGVVNAVDLPEAFLARGIQGVLGADVLSNFAVVAVDYREGVLRLSP